MERSILLACALLVTLLPGAPSAQDTAEPIAPLPEEARRRLEYAVGAWDVRTEFLDPEGRVQPIEESTHDARFSIPGRLVELTSVTPSSGRGKAWLFYGMQDGLFYLTSVDQRGDLWVLTGGLDQYVLTSLPRPMEDGSMLTARLTYLNPTAGSYETLMDVSTNGGATWRTVFRQKITRRGSVPETRPGRAGSPE